MNGTAKADWSHPLDYYKWTMALAVAAVVYVPERFLPAVGPRFAVVALAFLLLSASCLMGFLLFGGIVRRLSGRSGDQPSEQALDTLGFAHLATLIVGFLMTVGLFFVDSFFLRGADPACRVELKSDAGTVSFDLDSCTVKGKA